jgi:hypothetical protein
VKALDLLIARRGEDEADRRRQRPTRDEADVFGARRTIPTERTLRRPVRTGSVAPPAAGLVIGRR